MSDDVLTLSDEDEWNEYFEDVDFVHLYRSDGFLSVTVSTEIFLNSFAQGYIVKAFDAYCDGLLPLDMYFTIETNGVMHSKKHILIQKTIE